MDGALLGAKLGAADGALLGAPEGATLGAPLGAPEGASVDVSSASAKQPLATMLYF